MNFTITITLETRLGDSSSTTGLTGRGSCYTEVECVTFQDILLLQRPLTIQTVKLCMTSLRIANSGMRWVVLSVRFQIWLTSRLCFWSYSRLTLILTFWEASHIFPNITFSWILAFYIVSHTPRAFPICEKNHRYFLKNQWMSISFIFIGFMSNPRFLGALVNFRKISFFFI